MAETITIDPITRIEGHLRIDVTVENGKVTDARSAGEMFRGFENLLKGRHPVDANQITQRICGVCPASHAQASALNLDDALGVTPPENGRLIRNLMLGANYIQSHILHFYHLAALDFVDITKILAYKGSDPKLLKVKAWVKAQVGTGRATAAAPFLPRYEGAYIEDTDLNLAAIAHYVEALEMRRKAHEALCLWGGKMPHAIAIFPGGASERVTADKVASYASLIDEMREFIDRVYIPDVCYVADAFPDYFKIGRGCGNLLAYGTFAEDAEGKEKLLPPGVYLDGKAQAFSPDKIREYVKHSRYGSPSGLHPSEGETEADVHKKGAYSWLKAPRYDDKVVEVGPLARIGVAHVTGASRTISDLVNKVLKRYNAGVSALFSTLGRHAARALECKVVADRCAAWALQLKAGKPVHTAYEIPEASEGMGLTEAPRGALGHWITIKKKKIDRYQCVVPTTWNASPRDDKERLGPIEQALLGCPVADPKNPLEPARVVRSFDPCIACAVHTVSPAGRTLGSFRVF